jgi:hypothetical protein
VEFGGIVNGSEYTLAEVVDLERPAWHVTRSGAVDFIYDGINFWCGRIGNPCRPGVGESLPRSGWRHKDGCRCPRCREARRVKRAQRRKST